MSLLNLKKKNFYKPSNQKYSYLVKKMEFKNSSSSENSHKMIYVSDLPRTTSYLDVADFYEKNVGACQICIKR